MSNIQRLLKRGTTAVRTTHMIAARQQLNFAARRAAALVTDRR
jgi:hypothetical protein